MDFLTLKVWNTVARDDISDRLIHFTKGDDAFETLRTILHECRLIGGNGFIKGGYNCVCFSEAPLTALKDGLLNSNSYSRFSSFGVSFNKKWIFEQGGRPAIYQPDIEYAALPESHKWRHVRYEPTANEPIDFTWEREWRIQTDELRFDCSVVAIVVPTCYWAERLFDEHETEQDYKILAYSQIMNEELALQYRDSFDWLIYVLR